MAKKIHNKILNTVSKQNDFYIRKNPDNLNAEQLATATNVNLIIVERLLAEEQVLAEKAVAEQKAKEKKKDTPFQEVLGRKKRNEEHVATVMTKAAAQIADASRRKNSSKKDDLRFIHKPKGD